MQGRGVRSGGSWRDGESVASGSSRRVLGHGGLCRRGSGA